MRPVIVNRFPTPDIFG